MLQARMPFDRHRLFDDATAPQPARLLWPDELPAEMRAEHAFNLPIPAVELVTIRAGVFGGLGLFRQGAALAFDPAMTPDYIPHLVTHFGLAATIMKTWTGGLLRDDTSAVASDVPVLVPINPNWIFGHFLLEMMLRAMVLDQTSPPDWPIALADPGPHWLPDLLRLILPKRPFLRYDPATEVVQAPAFVGCTEVVTRSGIAPGVQPLITMLKTRLLATTVTASGPAPEPSPDMVFLSRGTNRIQRNVENRTEIENIAADLGFAIIRPETLPFVDQVRLMDGAHVVAGEFGSAMHNTLFCRAGTTVVCLNWINAYQSIIARSCDLVAGYITPDDGAFRDATAIWSGKRQMRFDLTEVRRKLQEVANAVP